VVNRQCGFQKTRLRGMLKIRCQVNVLAALANLRSWPATYCWAKRDRLSRVAFEGNQCSQRWSLHGLKPFLSSRLRLKAFYMSL
jgi:hypothetical protein